MRISAKRLRLALRSPRSLASSMRHVLRSTPLGQIDRLVLNGTSFRPNLMTINITSRCNLRCAMCMQPRGDFGDDDCEAMRSRGKELTPEQWCNVVDQAASARPVFYISGGEPLLYKGLDCVLRRIADRGLMAAIVTNGVLLEQRATDLVEARVANVTVSLDGPEAVHDRIRGLPGAFRRAMEGIRALRGIQKSSGTTIPAIKVNCVITPDNIDYLEETAALVRDMGIEELNFQHPMFDSADNVALHNRIFHDALHDAGCEPRACPERREGEFYDTAFTEEQFEKIEAALRRLRARTGLPTRIQFFPAVRRRDWRGYYLDPRHPFPRRCLSPWTTMRLQPDGAFEPCLHFVVGNVLETPLWDLWNAPQMRAFRRALKRNGLFPACSRCCYRCY